MRVFLTLLLTLSLVTLLLPGVSAETYRYVAAPAPGPQCHDDILTGTDGICFGSVTFPLTNTVVVIVQDDVFGEAAHWICLHDAEGCDADSTKEPVACGGARFIQDGTGATHATVFFPTILLVTEDLEVCGATTGTVTV